VHPEAGTSPALSPLDPREFFARRWTGEGEWLPRRALRRLPGPRRLRFETSTTWLTDDLWVVHDTTTWEDGRVERRDGIAKLTAPDRIRFTYDDMPGGTEIALRPDGFDFEPYTMVVMLPPLPVPLHLQARDRCRWDATAGVLSDAIELSLAGIPLGRQEMSLRPA
jgi:hypothetical protein